MFIAGAQYLAAEKEYINSLNVFPVPDGDTGSNMTMTIMAAVEALRQADTDDMESVAKAISSGSLRGARGNSGVILSQLFRGFTKEIRQHETLRAPVLAQAMQRAVETAYKAVMKPKEGTILTVAKSMADEAGILAQDTSDLGDFFDLVLAKGDETLERTPDMLPVLKEAGVVDSGGKGLLVVLHGAIDRFHGKEIDLTLPAEKAAAPVSSGMPREHIETDDIRFGYCTEFIILLEKPFSESDEEEMKAFLSGIGDSLVLVSDDEVVKVHVHTNDPGLAIQKALAYGQLTRMKIDNMREEHRETLFREAQQPPKNVSAEKAEEEKAPRKAAAFIAVCSGGGLSEIFLQLGADRIVSGGQSMNPSTDDILEAVRAVNADDVFVLPNNKNIILAANQAAALAEDCCVHVIPSKTVPQGISALVGYVPEHSVDQNISVMNECIALVKSGEVTYSVRDTRIDGKDIRTGDLIGIGDEGLLAVGTDLCAVVTEMCRRMDDGERELITVYTGEDFPADQADVIESALAEEFPELDVELHEGGQPVYYVILSVE